METHWSILNVWRELAEDHSGLVIKPQNHE